jgi:hypothetical protein
MHVRDCSRKVGVVRRRHKANTVLSKEIEEFSRGMSVSLSGSRLSPSAHAALVALIATLAELLGESPLAS